MAMYKTVKILKREGPLFHISGKQSKCLIVCLIMLSMLNLLVRLMSIAWRVGRWHAMICWVSTNLCCGHRVSIERKYPYKESYTVNSY